LQTACRTDRGERYRVEKLANPQDSQQESPADRRTRQPENIAASSNLRHVTSSG